MIEKNNSIWVGGVNKINADNGENQNIKNTLETVGYISSILLALVTTVTFFIAILTPPISGPLSTAASTAYPYTDIVSRFPRDYYWMYPAMLLALVYIVYMVCVNQYASKDRKIFSHTALLFACLSAGILFADYFVQVSIIQPSLLNGEYDAIALFTQYNPHGLFIALEEAGYLIMAIAILFLTPVFAGSGKIRAALRWTAVLNFIFIMLSLTVLSIIYGVSREYRFEIVVIAFDYIALILLGLLSAQLFRRKQGDGSFASLREE